MKLHPSLALLASAAIVFAPSLYAKEDAVMLKLKPVGAGGIEVTGTSAGGKVAAKSPTDITLLQPISSDKWETATLKFKVSEDADVQLRFSPEWTKADDKWVLIDNVKAEGATIENGDFEVRGKGPTPTGWQFRAGKSGSATHVADAKLAASGERFVKVSHGSPVVQIIHATKGAEITLTFSARPAAN